MDLRSRPTSFQSVRLFSSCAKFFFFSFLVDCCCCCCGTTSGRWTNCRPLLLSATCHSLRPQQQTGPSNGTAQHISIAVVIVSSIQFTCARKKKTLRILVVCKWDAKKKTECGERHVCVSSSAWGMNTPPVRPAPFVAAELTPGPAPMGGELRGGAWWRHGKLLQKSADLLRHVRTRMDWMDSMVAISLDYSLPFFSVVSSLLIGLVCSTCFEIDGAIDNQ